jgi:hypothetical protein
VLKIKKWNKFLSILIYKSYSSTYYFFNKLLLDELLLIIKNIITFNLLTQKTLSLTLISLFKGFFKYKIKVKTKAHWCFLKKGRGALWVCIWNQGGGGPKKFGNHWSSAWVPLPVGAGNIHRTQTDVAYSAFYLVRSGGSSITGKTARTAGSTITTV